MKWQAAAGYRRKGTGQRRHPGRAGGEAPEHSRGRRVPAQYELAEAKELGAVGAAGLKVAEAALRGNAWAIDVGVPIQAPLFTTICCGLTMAHFPSKSKRAFRVHQLLFLQQSLYPNHRSIFNNKLAESQTSVLEKKKSSGQVFLNVLYLLVTLE